MERLLILFLNFLLLSCNCAAQTSDHHIQRCNCLDKAVQDSLIEKYIEYGSQKLSGIYNNPGWLLYCDSLIAICPNIAFAYQQKAIPYIKNGEYEKAFALEDKAVELAPNEYTAYRGFLKCIFMKDYEGAILDFQKAQELTPGTYEMDHTYFFYFALCNLELGNYDSSEEYFREDAFIQTGGDSLKTIHFNTLFYYGVLYYEMKKYELSIQYLSKCLEQYKEHPDANYYLALVYKEEKNIELEKKYLMISKQSFEKGYSFNEDNVIYVNYPHLVKLYEVEQELKNIN